MPTKPLGSMLPGLLLCVGVALAAEIVEAGERVAFGRAPLEALVVAILLGAVLRTAIPPAARFDRGIRVGAVEVLEVAVALLGASVPLGALAALGPALAGGIVAIVIGAIGLGYGLGRALGLGPAAATLIACGNAICGNSAIAAIAPAIRASADDIAVSVAFTAVLGVAVVLLLPALIPILGLDARQYGILAGLTVYAVPQVLAAAAPAGPVAIGLGTLVKLVRVMLLGPVVLALTLAMARGATARDAVVPDGQAEGQGPGQGQGREQGRPQAAAPRRTALVPPFILVFLALAVARGCGLLPHVLLGPASHLASALTILAMAGLGLGVDARRVRAAGPRVIATVVTSLGALVSAALVLVEVLPGR